MKYARKSAIVDVEFAQEDGIANTWSGDLPYFRGDVVTKNEYGEVNVLSRLEFEEYFTPVVTAPKTDFSYEEITNGYAAMANLSQNEDEDYIVAMQNMAKNKAF